MDNDAGRAVVAFGRMMSLFAVYPRISHGYLLSVLWESGEGRAVLLEIYIT